MNLEDHQFIFLKKLVVMHRKTFQKFH